MNPLLSTEYLVLIFAATAVSIGYLSWKTTASHTTKLRLSVTALRLLAVLGLAILAFNPGEWIKLNQNMEKEWSVLLDSSFSMSVKDVGTQSRFNAASELCKELVNSKEPVKLYSFSSNLKTVEKNNIAQLKPNGSNTDILKSGLSLLNKYVHSSTKLNGIILLSDGRQVAPQIHKDFPILARSQNVPIYPVVFGGEVPEKDLVIALGRRYYLSYPEQIVKIPVTISNKNMGNIKLDINLFDIAGKLLKTQSVSVKNNDILKTDMMLKPTEKGYQEYRIGISEFDGENSFDNNHVRFAISLLEKKLNILLVEGVPFWDSKFLAQALRQDPNINLTSIYRLSAKRFFAVKNDNEDTEESTQAIFPDTAEDISKYDIIIFGKGAEYFLTPERISLVKQFLSDFGGSVLFARGKPYTKELPALNSIEPVEWGQLIHQDFKLVPTADGLQTGLFGDMLPDQHDQIWEKLPALERAYQCPKLKTFASALMGGQFHKYNKDTQFPVLISRKYAKGMVLAVNIEGLWKWSFFPESGNISRFYREFWIQLIHWLVKHSDYLPGQDYSLKLSQSVVMPGEPIGITISCRSNEKTDDRLAFEILKNKKVIQALSDITLKNEDHSWNRVFTFSEPGIYQLKLTCGDKQNEQIIYSMFTVKRLPGENDNLSADPNFLKKLALDSGGKLLDYKEIAKIIDSDGRNDDLNIDGQVEWQSLWDRWWILLFILAIFGLDYFIRRRSGLL